MGERLEHGKGMGEDGKHVKGMGEDGKHGKEMGQRLEAWERDGEAREKRGSDAD